LAHKILGALIPDKYMTAEAQTVAPWLIESVLKQWNTPCARSQPPLSHMAPIADYLRHPRGFFPDLVRRWPNPILATISVNGTFGARRRVRYEIGNWIMRAGRVLAHGSGILDPIKSNQ
jgi:hypothetical protein